MKETVMTVSVSVRVRGYPAKVTLKNDAGTAVQTITADKTYHVGVGDSILVEEVEPDVLTKAKEDPAKEEAPKLPPLKSAVAEPDKQPA
jgi:hypothetical protein